MLRIVAFLVVLAGCGGVTGPDGVHENEARILAITECIAGKFAEGAPGFAVEGRISERERLEPGGYAKGWADLRGHVVTFWGPWVRGEREVLEEWSLGMASAHEVCHVRYQTSDEEVVGWCTQVVYRDFGCS